MGWTVHYELRRALALAADERARLQRFATEHGEGWAVEPFGLRFEDGPRIAVGFTKLDGPQHEDVWRLLRVLGELRELIDGAELVVDDDFESVTWSEMIGGYALGGAAHGPVGTVTELEPDVLGVAWPGLWLRVADWGDSVYASLSASGKNLAAGKAEVKRVGVAYVDASGAVLHRDDTTAWRAVTATPREHSHGLGYVTKELWRRIAAVEVHVTVQRDYSEKILSATPSGDGIKLAPGRKKLRNDVQLSRRDDWLRAEFDVELRMPAVDRITVKMAAVDGAGNELRAISPYADGGGPRIAMVLGVDVRDAAAIELHAMGRSERTAKIATLRLRRP